MAQRAARGRIAGIAQGDARAAERARQFGLVPGHGLLRQTLQPLHHVVVGHLAIGQRTGKHLHAFKQRRRAYFGLPGHACRVEIRQRCGC